MQHFGEQRVLDGVARLIQGIGEKASGGLRQRTDALKNQLFLSFGEAPSELYRAVALVALQSRGQTVDYAVDVGGGEECVILVFGKPRAVCWRRHVQATRRTVRS
ncbi:hypothetical protein GCM10027056_31090 [Glaciibacter psychrotolerans]